MGVNASQKVGVRIETVGAFASIGSGGVASVLFLVLHMLVNIPTLLFDNFDNTFMTFNCSAVVYQTLLYKNVIVK